VESIQVYKPIHNGKSRKDCQDGYVYNFEVEDFHTYIANGIVVHNCHHCLKENKWGKCVQSLPNSFGLGVTATPIRSDKKGLGSGYDGVFDEMIVGSTMGELITSGNLSMYKIFVPPQLLDVTGLKITASGEFNQKELARRTDRIDITGDTVQQYLKLANGLQTIIFTVNISHAEHVAEEFNRAGISAVALSSKTPLTERTKALIDFENGNIKVLVNCDLFGEGYDCPAVSCVIMLRKTESYALFKQQFGRLLRVFEGKPFGVLIDQVGNVQRHCIYGAPHDDPVWTLERTKKKIGDDEKPSGRICPECFAFYVPNVRNRLVCAECNHEETKEQTNDEMKKFITNNTDLVEMNVEFIDIMMIERNKVDMNPAKLRQNMKKGHMKTVIINSAVNNHTKRQFAQKSLRNVILQWSHDVSVENNWDILTTQLFFEKTFKVNIFKAQVLSERLSLKLLEEIKNER
jgi:superfamily II DNA or RNA helicase